jgi:glycosyltransferase involved in cell wall biosynthesis
MKAEDRSVVLNNQRDRPRRRASTGRAFICDPVCALPYGHNVAGLRFFADALRPHFATVEPIASTALPNDLAMTHGFQREFDFYYHEQIKLDARCQTVAKRRSQTSVLSSDRILDAAIQDFSSIFEKYKIESSDVVLFPSVDYYGGMGLFEALLKTEAKKAPAAYLRFIGVMENATSFGAAGLPSFVRKLKSLIEHGYVFKFSAETPRYADHLAQLLCAAVTVVPWPTNSSGARAESSATDRYEDAGVAFTVACPGSARLDKGYLSLFEIFAQVRRLDPQQSIRLITQALPVGDSLRHTAYTNQLYAIPGVRILPASLSDREIESVYASTDLVLLPYDPGIYANRGSAIFMECLARGIPVVGLAGSAFCDQISYYGAGTIVHDVSGFVTEILRFRDTPRPARTVRMMQALHRYRIDADTAIERWVQQ